MAETWNPLFVAYARVHGHEPQQQLDHDQKAWPGGCMCGFMLWMFALKERFRKLHPEAFFEPETSTGASVTTRPGTLSLRRRLRMVGRAVEGAGLLNPWVA